MVLQRNTVHYSNVLNDLALPRKIFLAANREARYATTDFDSDIRVGQKSLESQNGITKFNQFQREISLTRLRPLNAPCMPPPPEQPGRAIHGTVL